MCAKRKGTIKDQEYAAFMKLCKGAEDPTLLILRIHLLAESYLERIIHASLPRGDRMIDDGNLSFYQKIILVESLSCVSSKVIQSLRGLNKVRNGCAHEAEKQISLAEIDVIGRPFGPSFTDMKRRGHVPTRLLFEVLSYMTGYLAGSVDAVEEKALSQLQKKKDANQAPEPTATSVTPPAAQEPRQP